MSRIFISHSSKDSKVAKRICSALEAKGLGCWIASRDINPGENFGEAIVNAIRGAKVMLLVFTQNANNSDEIKKELVLAGHNRLIVIPVRVEDIEPGGAFAYELATRQWIDLFEDWDREMDRLGAWIQKTIAVVDSAPPPTPVPPPRIEAQVARTLSPDHDGGPPAVPNPARTEAAPLAPAPPASPVAPPPPSAGTNPDRPEVAVGERDPHVRDDGLAASARDLGALGAEARESAPRGNRPDDAPAEATAPSPPAKPLPMPLPLPAVATQPVVQPVPSVDERPATAATTAASASGGVATIGHGGVRPVPSAASRPPLSDRTLCLVIMAIAAFRVVVVLLSVRSGRFDNQTILFGYVPTICLIACEIGAWWVTARDGDRSSRAVRQFGAIALAVELGGAAFGAFLIVVRSGGLDAPSHFFWFIVEFYFVSAPALAVMVLLYRAWRVDAAGLRPSARVGRIDPPPSPGTEQAPVSPARSSLETGLACLLLAVAATRIGFVGLTVLSPDPSRLDPVDMVLGIAIPVLLGLLEVWAAAIVLRRAEPSRRVGLFGIAWGLAETLALMFAVLGIYPNCLTGSRCVPPTQYRDVWMVLGSGILSPLAFLAACLLLGRWRRRAAARPEVAATDPEPAAASPHVKV